MHEDFRKMYPVSGNKKVFMDAPDVVTISTTTGTVNLANYGASTVYITFTNSTATSITVTNPQVGQTIILQQNSTGTNTHAAVFTGRTLDASSHTTATTNADDETLVLYAATTSRLVVIANTGSVALS